MVKKFEGSFYDVLDYCYLKNYRDWKQTILMQGETCFYDGNEDSFQCPCCKKWFYSTDCDNFKLTPDEDMNSYFYCPECENTI